MAIILLSDADARLAEAAAFAASGAATGFAVHVLVTGAALARVAAGSLPPGVAATLGDARDVGEVRVYACSAALARLGLAPDRIGDRSASGALAIDAVVGIPTFLEPLAGAEVQLVF
jgi:peroxiredoxin family protein